MKFLEPYYFETDSLVSQDRLLDKLSEVADVRDQSFSILSSENFSVRGVAEVHGRVIPERNGSVLHAHIAPSRVFKIGAIVWIVFTLIVFAIALVNEIKFHYFNAGIFFIAAIGAIGHLSTIWLYKASVKANIEFLSKLAELRQN